MVSELAKSISDVRHVFPDDLFKQGREFGQGCVVHVFEPAFNEDSIVWLQLEVLSHVVDDYCFCEVSANSTQILYEYWTMRQRMLSIESVFYAFFFIYLVQNPIGVLNHKSISNFYLRLA